MPLLSNIYLYSLQGTLTIQATGLGGILVVRLSNLENLANQIALLKSINFDLPMVINIAKKNLGTPKILIPKQC